MNNIGAANKAAAGISAITGGINDLKGKTPDKDPPKTANNASDPAFSLVFKDQAFVNQVRNIVDTNGKIDWSAVRPKEGVTTSDLQYLIKELTESRSSPSIAGSTPPSVELREIIDKTLKVQVVGSWS